VSKLSKSLLLCNIDHTQCMYHSCDRIMSSVYNHNHVISIQVMKDKKRKRGHAIVLRQMSIKPIRIREKKKFHIDCCVFQKHVSN